MVSLSLHQSGDSWTLNLLSVKITESFGHMIGCHLTGGEVMALKGDLGAGKTVFIRGLASGLDIDPKNVTSPTFTLIHEYHGRLPLIHADLYRLEHHQELANIGFDEYLNSASIVAIEWAERMGEDLPRDRLEIYLEHQKRSGRKATLTSIGSRSHDLMSKILNQVTK